VPSTASGTVGPARLALMTHYTAHKVGGEVRVTERYQMLGQVGHYRLSVSIFGRTVSAECVTSLSAYFRFRPKVKLPLSVDL